MLFRSRAGASSGEVVVGVRHGHVLLHRQEHPAAMPARIYTVEPTGDLTFVHIRLGSLLLVASTDPSFQARPDDPIWIEFDQEHLHLFDTATDTALLLEDGVGVPAIPVAGEAPSSTPPPGEGPKIAVAAAEAAALADR